MNTTYKNLVFEGGGVRGYAYKGVIEELNNMGILKNFTRFAGTSIGALFAALLAVGFTSYEIKYMDIDMLNFKEKCIITNIFNTINYFGIYNSKILETQISKILKDRIDPNLTLKELYDKNGKELVTVTCCLNRKKAVYLHYKKYPDVKLIDAICSSLLVPFLFQARIYNFESTEDYYIDGGIVNNYPIWIFNDLELLNNGNTDEIRKEEISPETLGIKLLSHDETNSYEVFKGRETINNLSELIPEIINTLILQNERSNISKLYITQTIPIYTGKVYFLNFKLTDKDKEFLSKSGIDAVRKYFEQFQIKNEKLQISDIIST